MTYWLGIDLGTTYTAAAVCRRSGDTYETQVVPLGTRTAVAPSVLFVGADGSLVVGEAAQRRAVSDPDRVVREFKNRVGDAVPVVVGGSTYPADRLAALLVHWVWQRVLEREGEPPAGVVLTCPASWGPYRTGLLERAVRETGIGEVTLLGEPQAAAIDYASKERVDVGCRLAVYDLGGGTFDAAVVRKDSPTTFTVLGRPEGIDGIGGVAFDEALCAHVCAAAGAPLDRIDPDDPDVVSEVAALRRECTEAKEALSVDTDTTIPVVIGGVRQRVRVTRAEFEELIRSDVEQTIDALRRALESAELDEQDLDAILLIGGSSRIPLVSQVISAEFGRAPAIDTDPKTAVAAGAARCAASLSAPAADAEPSTAVLASVPPQRPALSSMLADDQGNEQEEPARRTRRPVRLVAVAVLVLLVAGAVAALRVPGLGGLFAHSTSRKASNTAVLPPTGATATRSPAVQRSAGSSEPTVASASGQHDGTTGASAPGHTPQRSGRPSNSRGSGRTPPATPSSTPTPAPSPTTPSSPATQSPTPSSTPTPAPTTSSSPSPAPTHTGTSTTSMPLGTTGGQGDSTPLL